jgi:tetratricopeptide (TPR) repeat protein
MNKLLGISTFSLLALIILLILNSYQLHWAELDWKLQRVSFLDSKITSNHMIGKLTNQQRIFHDEITQSEVDKENYSLQKNLKFQKIELDKKSSTNSGPLFFINKSIINGIRKLTSVDPLPDQADINSIKLLGQAFLLESQNEYQTAIKIYEKILQSDIEDQRMRSTALLHKGFCHSMMNFPQQAAQQYKDIILKEKNTDLGFTASLLLQYQQTIEREKQMLLEQNFDDLLRAKKLVQLQQCTSADSILSRIEGVNPEQEGQISYLKGQCLEFMGKKELASKQYLKSIEKVGMSATAYDANRRILMLGSEIKGQKGEDLKEMATEINKVLEDTSFTQAAEAIVKDNQILEDNKATISSSSQIVSSSSLAKVAELDQNDSLYQELEKQSVENLFYKTKNSLKEIKSKLIEEIKPKVVESKSPLLGWKTGSRVQFTTLDGKAFRGKLISDPQARVIRIQTMIGIIGIPRNQLKIN